MGAEEPARLFELDLLLRFVYFDGLAAGRTG